VKVDQPDKKLTQLGIAATSNTANTTQKNPAGLLSTGRSSLSEHRGVDDRNTLESDLTSRSGEMSGHHDGVSQKTDAAEEDEGLLGKVKRTLGI
jgi:hypothetical protein